jgi:ferredoxin-type protein NapG
MDQEKTAMAENDPNPNEERGNPGLARREFFRRFILKGLDKAEATGRSVAGRFDDVIAAAGGVEASLRPSDAPAPTSSIPSLSPVPPARFLRPPGALAELPLAETCSRCGDCVKACPAQAIRLEPAVAGGLPFIVPREQPCVVCTDLACMKVCPTGALKRVSAVSEISMGVAVVDHARCLRGPFDAEPRVEPADSLHAAGGARGRGEDCRLCVTSCPVGESAIAIGGGGRVVILAGCIGCGVCERACPTEPTSIFIRAE